MNNLLSNKIVGPEIVKIPVIEISRIKDVF